MNPQPTDSLRHPPSPDYVDGYKQGFADALESTIEAEQRKSAPPPIVIEGTRASTPASASAAQQARELVKGLLGRELRVRDAEAIDRITSALEAATAAERERIRIAVEAIAHDDDERIVSIYRDDVLAAIATETVREDEDAEV